MNRKLFSQLVCSLAFLFSTFSSTAFSAIDYNYSATWPDKKTWDLDSPSGIAIGTDGKIYVVERNNNRFLQITIVGDYVQVQPWGAQGSEVGQFNMPTGMAIGPNGDLFFADSVNHRIQKWPTSSGYPTFANISWGTEGNGDGQFSYPSGVAVDSGGNVYVADKWNHRVQKFTSAGVFSTKWGSEGSGNGQFSLPSAIAVDSSGNVYVADTGNNRIQKFNSSGGYLGQWGGTGTGDGQFRAPSGIAVDVNRNVYVADSANNRIQKFSETGSFLLKWGSKGVNDGEFFYPMGIGIDAAGIIYVTEYGNSRIQKFNSQGFFVENWNNMGTGDGYFMRPFAAAVDGSGNVFVSDSFNSRIQKFNSEGVLQVKWGSFGAGNGQFRYPAGVALDSGGNIYVADMFNDRIQKFNSGGTFQSSIGTSGSGDGQFDFPMGAVIDASNNLYVLDSGNNRVQKFAPNGSFAGKWGSAGMGDGQFDFPTGIAVDGSGNIYVSDTWNNRIQKFSSSGSFITKWGAFGAEEGNFNYPTGLALDVKGDVYVTDSDNNRIQKFTADGTFVAAYGFEGSDTPQSSILTAKFKHPQGIAFNKGGDSLYVVDTDNNRVQKYQLSGIQLNTPKSGEHWQRGMTRKISWTCMGTSGILYIDLVKNGDLVSYIPPTANLSTPPTPIALQNGNGSYDWAIPAGLELGTDYQIYIQAIAPPKVSDSMGDFFSITGPQNTLAIAGATGSAGGSISGGIGLNCRIAANGAVAGTCSEYNDPNASIVLTAAPDPGATVTWSGCTSATGNTCNVTLSSNKTVSASFNTASYTITASPGANGTISCVPTSVVSNGSSVCTITPNSGYYVSDVMVGPSGGTLSSVGRLTSYTFSGVITDMTISATLPD